MKSTRATSGIDEHRGEAVGSVAGSTRDCNKVEVVAVRTKRPEIIDPSFVAKQSISRY